MSYRDFRALPVYKKALELSRTSKEIASYVSFDKDLLKLCHSNSLRDVIAGSLFTDAVLIQKKIALAESSGSHIERVKSATYINIMIRNINSYCNGLERDGVREKEYLNLLRKEIKSFRKTFKKWRNSFPDKGNSYWH